MRFFLLLATSLLFVPVLRAADLAAEVLTEVNLARTQPQLYARLLAQSSPRCSEKSLRETVRFLDNAKPLPALTVADGMNRAAVAHVLDSGSRGGRGHRGSDGSMPWDRISRYGKWSGASAENIYYGRENARGIVAVLLIDEGISGKKHRANIFSRSFRVTGIACGGHAVGGGICVMDFANSFAEASSSQIAAR